jgi:hypothetical protein
MANKITTRKARKPSVVPKAKTVTRNHNAATRAATALAPNPGRPLPRRGTRRPLPAKSLHNAATAFKNFSLSRFAPGATPANYVPTGQAKTPSTVRTVQRKAIARQLTTVAGMAPTNPGLTLALPSAVMKSLLPSFDGKTVDVTELLNVLKQRLPGTELYTSGEPTVTRIVQEAQQLAQVQAFINAIKAGDA